MDYLTDRQYIAFHAYYVSGWSYVTISNTLGCTKQNAHALVSTARAKVIRAYGDEDIDFPVLVEGLLRPSPTASVTSNVGNATSRQDKLWAALQLRMQERAKELGDIEECMGHDCALPTKGSGGRGGISVGPNGTRWPPEKWQHPDGRVETLPQDE
jgi:hypothetical protein